MTRTPYLCPKCYKYAIVLTEVTRPRVWFPEETYTWLRADCTMKGCGYSACRAQATGQELERVIDRAKESVL